MITTAAVLHMPGARRPRRAAPDRRRHRRRVIEFDVVGRARGLIAAEHVHTGQTEHYEVIEGAMRLRDRRPRAPARPRRRDGDAARHAARQLPGGEGEGRVRVTLRPAGRTQEFLRRLAALKLNRFGWPGPVDAAAIVRDFGARRPRDPAVGARPARALARRARASPRASTCSSTSGTSPRRASAVFPAISDARTYPQWWKPVYIDVDADGEPEVGKESRQHFKGRLPYHLHTRSTITRLEPPQVIEADVDGDLRGHGKWTLTENADGGTHVRFDWQVFADKPLLRVLTPILRPAFRWNHAWAIARAREGLEPFARDNAPCTGTHRAVGRRGTASCCSS